MIIHFPFRYKTVMGAALFSILFSITGLSYFYFWVNETAWNQMTHRLQDTARSGVTLLDGSDVMVLGNLEDTIHESTIAEIPDSKTLRPNGYDSGISEEKAKEISKSEDFRQIVEYLKKVKSLTDPDPGGGGDRRQQDSKKSIRILYAYILAKIPGSQNSDVVQFIADADFVYGEPTAPGTLFNLSRKDSLKEAFVGKVSVDHDLIQGTWGDQISGYAPIQNEKGEVIGVLGLDMSVDRKNNVVLSEFWHYLIIAALALLFSFGLFILLSGIRVRK